MGGISVARLRGQTPRPTVLRQNRLRVGGIKIHGNQAPQVVYSLPLQDLRTNEQMTVYARVAASAVKLATRARLSTHVFLADSPTQTSPGSGYASQVAANKGRVTKRNGFNYLPGRVGPPTEKVGVSADDQGRCALKDSLLERRLRRRRPEQAVAGLGSAEAQEHWLYRGPALSSHGVWLASAGTALAAQPALPGSGDAAGLALAATLRPGARSLVAGVRARAAGQRVVAVAAQQVVRAVGAIERVVAVCTR